MNTSELYPIRTVSTLTGVNAVTLRAWERRYGLIAPQRTAKGHRLYTRDDIDLINQVVRLVDQGLPIGQVRMVLDTGASARKPKRVDGEPWAQYRQRILEAIIQFDEDVIETVYSDALSLYPVDTVTNKLLLPLLRELGNRWESAEGSVAEEHFFGVYLRNKLGARFHHRHRHANGPRLLLACIPGEHHEIGMLLLALSAHDRGYSSILLGPDMPFADLPLAVKRSAADAIVLSGSIEPTAKVLKEDLPALVRAVTIPVFLGGLTSVNQRDAIIGAGAVPLGDDIQSGLKRLSKLLKKPVS